MLAPPLCDSSCCATCEIFTDDFSADLTGTDYTTVSGTPSVSGGVLTTTSSGFLIVEDAAGVTGHGRVTITGQSSASGGTFRVVGSYVDSNNYLFGELTINGASSTWKLWQRISGTDTQIGPTITFTASTATDYTICVSWDGTYATDLATIGFVNKLIRANFTGSGNQAGFGASPNGGTVTFDNFTFAKNKIDDATCATCGGSTGCGTPEYAGGFEFNVANMNDPGPGGCCVDFEGLYVIPFQVDTAGNYTPCAGMIDVGFDPCFGGAVRAAWGIGGGPRPLQFKVETYTATPWIHFGIALNSDLSTYSGDSMTQTSGGWACNQMNSANATCTITSI